MWQKKQKKLYFFWFWKILRLKMKWEILRILLRNWLEQCPVTRIRKKLFAFSSFTEKWTFWDVSLSKRKKKSSFINIFWLWRSNFSNFFLLLLYLKTFFFLLLSNWTNFFFNLLHFQLFSCTVETLSVGSKMNKSCRRGVSPSWWPLKIVYATQ